MKKVIERVGWVYVLINLVNGKEYVGQTVRGILVRLREHLKAAFEEQNQKPLYRAMRRATAKNFIVAELWIGPQSKLNAAERRFIRQRRTFIDTGWGYNLTTGGGQCIVSARTRKKQSLAHRGIPLSLEHSAAVAKILRRADVQAATLAYRRTPKARATMSDLMSSKYRTDPILREQLRASANAAYANDDTLKARLSKSQKIAQNKPETIAKHSASKTGRKLTKAHKKAIGKSLAGRVVKASTRIAISMAKLGVKRSPEVCKILRKALKKAWKNPELRTRQSVSHCRPWTKKRRAAYEQSAAARSGYS
jgi:group I intron endonuclease